MRANPNMPNAIGFRTVLLLLLALPAVSAAEDTVLRFEPHLIDTTLPVYQTPQGWPVGDYGASGLADLDRDGDLDFTIGRHGSGGGPSLVYWYEFQAPSQWERHVAGHDTPTDVGGEVLDVDGDGWVDIVHGGVWYRNSGEPRSREFERKVYDPAGGGMHDVVATDVDGDGAQDLVTMYDRDGLFWYRLPGFKKHRVADGIHGGVAPAGAGDLDGDGDTDLFRGNLWAENTDGRGTEWIEHAVPISQERPADQRVISFRSWIADLDQDGDNDVAITDCDWMTAARIRWLENRDGRGRTWTEHAVGQSIDFHSLAVADFDADGDLDLFTCDAEEGPRGFKWYLHENLDGRASRFTTHVVLDQNLGGHETRFGDVDGDDDLDLVSKPWTPSRENGVGGKMHVIFLENQARR